MNIPEILAVADELEGACSGRGWSCDDDALQRAMRRLARRLRAAVPPMDKDEGVTFCEDCDGSGGQGELHYMGEFQPPEREPCSTCGGSGYALIPEPRDEREAVADELERLADRMEAVFNSGQPVDFDSFAEYTRNLGRVLRGGGK